MNLYNNCFFLFNFNFFLIFVSVLRKIKLKCKCNKKNYVLPTQQDAITLNDS